MKYFLNIIFLFTLIINGQTSGNIEYVVSTNFKLPYNTLGILKFDDSKSKYSLLSSVEANKTTRTTFNKNEITLSLPEYTSRPTNYVDLTDSIIVSNVPLIKSIYLVKEKIPIIQWKIENEFKKINEFKCQKAIGYFRGRTYTVWFTNSIPVPFGPWKLQGLPGLILTAQDEKNEVMFTASKVSFKNIEPIEFPKDNSTISLKEYITETIPNTYKKLEALANAKSRYRTTTIKLALPDRYTTKEIIYEWEELNKKEN